MRRRGQVRRTGVIVLALAMPPMAAGAPAGAHSPLPTASGVESAVVRLVDWVTGAKPPAPHVPQQVSGKAPGPQHPVPAAVTRAVERAEGYKPGKGKGQLPAYAFPAAKVSKHVTGLADLGNAASFSPATSKLVSSGSTATSELYKNADGSYTRLESPSQAAASASGQETVSFAGVTGTGVKGAHVTSVAVRVRASWPGRCPSSASVSLSDSAGQRVGRWTGRPSAADCGNPSGGWVTVPLSRAGIAALSGKDGGTLTVTASSAAGSSPSSAATSAAGTQALSAKLVSPAATASAPASRSATARPSAAPSASSVSPSPSSSGAAKSSAGSSAVSSAVVLEVTEASTQAPQVNSQWPPDGYDAQSLTPELVATGQVFDGSAPQYQFTVFDTSGNVVTQESPASTTPDWVVPAGKLSWGQTYYWIVQVFDDEGDGSADPVQANALSTPVAQPSVSENLAQDGARQGDGTASTGPGYDAQNGNFTTQATDATVNVTGPALSVQRTYNSLDGTATGAFGTGWTSVADMSVRPGRQNAHGTTETRIVTYPDGEQVAFGLNASGSYTPAQGRYGTLIPDSSGSGFDLVDKTDTTYYLTQSLSSGAYGLASIVDEHGSPLDFTWSGGEVTKIESMTSKRSLYLTWSTPSGASYPHVASVATDPVTPGDSSTAITWDYGYDGDDLTKACNESESGVPCTTYAYAAGSDYPSAVLDSDPASYWRLDETSGSAAVSSVLANEGADDGTYVSPEFNFASNPVAGEPSSVQVVGFNGTSSYVQLPASLGDDGAVRSVSLWFDTNGGSNQVLMSQSADPITDSSTSNPYSPVMYIGSDGKLNAGFPGSSTELQSTSAVNDYNPHNAVLTSNGSQETLYIDGKQVATATESATPFIEPYTYLGAGFLGGSNPDESNSGKTAAPAFFNGAMADTATWDRALTSAEVSSLYTVAKTPAALATTITRPSGKTFETVNYDAKTSHVTSLTDSNHGSWAVNTPTVSGTSQVYVSAVKGGQPLDYWRLGDIGTTTAVNQIANSGTATYNNVTQGVSGGQFADSTVDSFNGTSSDLSLPGSLITPDNESISLWFKTPSGAGQEVLFSSSADSPANGDTSNGFTPNLYIGSDGLLNAEFDDDDSPLVSQTALNDGNWHNVVLTADTSGDESLYVDGVLAGSVSGETLVGGTAEGQDQVFVGTGFLGSDWADQSHYSTTSSTGYPSYFTGDISDVAVYPHAVSAADVTAMWAAAQHSQGLSPVATATVTDPGNKTLTYKFDPVNSGRELSYTDGLNATTTYGYDSGGFQDQVIDPDGDFTDTGYDIRGNVVATITCQDQATYKCGTSYQTNSPNDTEATETSPWSANDQVMTTSDPRSSSPTDTTYQTKYVYANVAPASNGTAYPDANLLSMTAPPVPGSSSGRTTNYSYTDGSSTTGGYNGATPPANLLWKTVSPNGAVTETLYDANGDIGEKINANGVDTTYSYDGIGRKISQTVTASDTEPGGLTTTYSYDASGNVLKQTDPGTTDRVTGTTHTEQIATTYDIDGNKMSQVTSDTTGGDKSQTESWTYNNYDQQASSADGAGTVTDYTYDAYGNKASQAVDPSGKDRVTDYTYDPDRRLLTTTLEKYTGSPSGSQSAANLVEQSKAYDLAGRLASVTDAMNRVTSYAYTDNGLTASVTKTGPNGSGSYVEEKDTYDAAGNLTVKVTNNGATTTDYAVDAGNQVTSQTVDPSGLDRVTSYTYDPDDHMLTQDVSQGSGTPLQEESYTYDAMGDKTSQTIQDPGAEGPAGWWNLTQGSGTTVKDESGTGNTATAPSGTTWSSTGVRFSGQNGQDVTTRGPVVDTTGSYSVSAWVNMAALTGGDEVAVSQDAGLDAGFYLGYDSSLGTWAFEQPEADDSAPVFADAKASSAAKTGTWVFLTAVYDANKQQSMLYVNGTSSGTATDSSPIVSHGPAEIGASKFDGQAGQAAFDGTVNNVEMYPSALSASEVSNLYGQGSSSGNGTSSGDLTRDALTTSYTVDKLGQVVAQTDPDQVTTTYAYDQAGKQSEVTEPQTDAETGGGTPAASVATTFTGYDIYGNVAETEDSNGNVTSYTYDGDNRQLTQTLPAYTPSGASSPVGGTTTSVYDTLGEKTSQTDPDNHQTTYAYDQLGNRTSQTDIGTGGTTKTSYDADGEQLSQTLPTGAETTATYDYLGRKLTSTDVERYATAGSTTPSASPASYTTTTSYAPTSIDPSGTWESSVQSPDGVTTAYGYDAAGEQTQSTNGAGNTTKYSYDALGRKTRITNPDGTYQTTTYDPAGNTTAQQNYSSSGTLLSGTSATYNGEGKQLSTTDADGNTTTFTYNTVGDLTAETQPVTSSKGIVTSFGYDLAGNRTRYTDGNGSNWLTTYNSRNEPATQVEPSTSQYTSAANSTTTLAYNGDGKITSQTEPGGVTESYTYDSLGNVLTQSGSGATAATATRTFTYDTDGHMLTAGTSNTAASGATSNATSETFTYDDRGMVSTAAGSAGSTTLGYNGDGDLSSVQDPAGTSSFTYDKDGRLATMDDPATGATLTYAYTPDSQVSSIAYGGSNDDTQSYGYNGLHQLTSDALTNGSTTVASISYGYDANGNLTSKTTSGFAGSGTNTYTYDEADRLTSWDNGTTTTDYAYDNDGNRTQAGSTTYSYDARDELTSDGSNTYAYTANGDLNTVTSDASGTVTTSTSDAYGQQGSQGSQSDTYDALGRDIRLTSGATTTNLSYQGTTGQLTSDGTSDYTWTPAGTLTGTKTSGSSALDLTDSHTDVVGQFTANGTALSGSREFGPWGAVAAINSALLGSLGYQSQYTSPVTGQTDMGARWYNPANGDFGNKDTVSNSPTPNSASASPYGYAADNPLINTDPTGHMIQCDGDCGSTAVAAETAAAQTAAAAAAAAAKAAAARAAAARAAAAKAAAAKAAEQNLVAADEADGLSLTPPSGVGDTSGILQAQSRDEVSVAESFTETQLSNEIVAADKADNFSLTPPSGVGDTSGIMQAQSRDETNNLISVVDHDVRSVLSGGCPSGFIRSSFADGQCAAINSTAGQQQINVFGHADTADEQVGGVLVPTAKFPWRDLVQVLLTGIAVGGTGLACELLEKACSLVSGGAQGVGEFFGTTGVNEGATAEVQAEQQAAMAASREAGGKAAVALTKSVGNVVIGGGAGALIYASSGDKGTTSGLVIAIVFGGAANGVGSLTSGFFGGLAEKAAESGEGGNVVWWTGLKYGTSISSGAALGTYQAILSDINSQPTIGSTGVSAIVGGIGSIPVNFEGSGGQ